MSQNGKKSKEIPRQAGFFGVFIGALLILGFCSWNYWYLLLETNDRLPESFQSVFPKNQVLSGYTDPVSIGVYDSAATRRVYRTMRFDYGRVLSSWGDFLRRLGLPYSEFLRIDQIDNYDLVILPFTSCLSDYEADRIKNFIADGGAVFMTGAVGSRFEDGSWRDEPIFGDIVGGRFVGNANPSPKGPARLELNRNLTVSLSWTPRKSLTIPPYNEVLVIRPIGTRMEIVARAPYYRGDGSYDNLVAFCYGPYLDGQFAWSGFRIGAYPTGDETAERAFRELFSNVIGMLADRPRVTTTTWPDEKMAALGLVIEVNDGLSLRLMNKISKTETPVSLLVSPREVKQLAESPGIRTMNVEWILHLETEYLTTVSSTPNLWLNKLKARTESLLGSKIFGVAFENLRLRQAAELALDAGFSYLLSPPTENIQEYPEIYASKRPMGPLEVPQVLSLAPYQRTLPKSLNPTDCILVMLTEDEFLEEEDLLSFAGNKKDDIWTTHPIDIVNWRSDRNSVVMDREFLPNDRLRLRMSNGSYSVFPQFPFTIHFKKTVSDVAIWPKAVGVPPPKVLSKSPTSWTFAIENFQSGRTLEYIFTPIW